MAEPALAPLERLDPAREWQPWEPDARQPFDLQWAGHLYRRAGFGASLAELRQAVKLGPAAAVDRLLAGDTGAEERLKFLVQTGETIAGQNNPVALRGWWLYCMLHSLHPLREKLTLFWHDHFATSITKVNSASLMFRQNLTLRQHALGKFPEFLLAMSKDPAMLVWLDSNSNVKGKPNENYAREVMELFSLGVATPESRHYTETDIREAARAFTGWHTDEEKFVFVGRLHDDGPKTILGKKGNWNGDDVLRLCLEQPVAARFLVRKLYRFLVSEREVPPDGLVEPLADEFRKSGYDIKTLVRRMLLSRHFYSAQAYRQKVKSPVDFALGAVWSLTSRTVPQGALVPQLDGMGQLLFAPPNVKGWPGGTAWLNTSTLLARHNFAMAVAVGTLRDTNQYRRKSRREELEEQFRQQAEDAERARAEAQRLAEEARLKAQGKPVPPRPVPRTPPPPPPPPGLDPVELVRQEKAEKPEAVVGLLLDLMVQTATPAARKKLVEFLTDGKPQGTDLDRRIRETVHMIMTLPEYQLS